MEAAKEGLRQGHIDGKRPASPTPRGVGPPMLALAKMLRTTRSSRSQRGARGSSGGLALRRARSWDEKQRHSVKWTDSVLV